jgi:membrane fusion protein (multidrug efflux system)
MFRFRTGSSRFESQENTMRTMPRPYSRPVFAPFLRQLPLVLVLMLSSLMVACGEKAANAQAPGGAPPPPEVAVVTVAAQDAPVYNELPGRVEATRVAQVRARVPGIVQKRMFQEGGEVKAGEVLYQIDPAQYEANLASAEANLARAEANQNQANSKARRYQPLVETNAISKQEFDDLVAIQKQTAADVQAAKAARETARLNLSYARVTAPISGRIGRALVTEGALVGQGEATQLAVVQQIDPIYVTLTQSNSELQDLRRAMSDGRLKRISKNEARVLLIDDSGKPVGEAGKLLFSEITVDEGTGSVLLRALFPNKDRNLLPGMYVRARLEQAVREKSITVPQQAVQRTGDKATVLVVGADNKVEARPVKTEGSQGDQWIIASGLKAGEKIIVEGFQKAQPGNPVKPVPWAAAGRQAAAQAKPAAAAHTPAAAKPAAPADKPEAKSTTGK